MRYYSLYMRFLEGKLRDGKNWYLYSPMKNSPHDLLASNHRWRKTTVMLWCFPLTGVDCKLGTGDTQKHISEGVKLLWVAGGGSCIYDIVSKKVLRWYLKRKYSTDTKNTIANDTNTFKWQRFELKWKIRKSKWTIPNHRAVKAIHNISPKQF